MKNIDKYFPNGSKITKIDKGYSVFLCTKKRIGFLSSGAEFHINSLEELTPERCEKEFKKHKPEEDPFVLDLKPTNKPFSYTNTRGQTYYLHEKEVQLRGSGRTQMIYFFGKTIKEGVINYLPAGKMVVENERTGLLFLKGR